MARNFVQSRSAQPSGQRRRGRRGGQKRRNRPQTSDGSRDRVAVYNNSVAIDHKSAQSSSRGTTEQSFTKVFIKGLDDRYDTRDKVEQLFAQFGAISQVNLVTDDSGRSKGIAYVTFAETKSALDACNHMSGHRLYVGRAFTAKERRERRHKWANSGIWRVVVKGLDRQVVDKTLFDEFSHFGSVLSYKVARNEQGDSLGYGFVVYLHEESAQMAIDEANGLVLNGRSVVVEKFVPYYERQRLEEQRVGRKLFVKNVQSESQVRQLFDGYGLIEDIEMFAHKRFGYVTFADAESADRALTDNATQSKLVSGRRLVVKKALPKRDRDPHFKPVHQFECQICLDTRKTDLLLAYGCEHQFCKDCVKNYLESMISDGTIDGLKCPETGCHRTADESLIKRSVSADIFKRYEKLMLKQVTKDMDDIISCPNGKCDALIPIDMYELKAECHKCRTAYCSNCLKKYHGDITTNPCPASDEEKRKQEAESERLISETCKKCPKCVSPIEKNDGCDHMTCRKCGHEFCWICLNDWALYHTCVIPEARPQPRAQPRQQLMNPANNQRRAEATPLRDRDERANELLTRTRYEELRRAQNRILANNDMAVVRTVHRPQLRVDDQNHLVRNEPNLVRASARPTVRNRDPVVDNTIRAPIARTNSVTNNDLSTLPPEARRPTASRPIGPAVTATNGVRTVRQILTAQPLLRNRRPEPIAQEKLRPSAVWPINPLLMFWPKAYRTNSGQHRNRTYEWRPTNRPYQRRSILSRIINGIKSISPLGKIKSEQ